MRFSRGFILFALLVALVGVTAEAQPPVQGETAGRTERAKDALGRTSPRGTVFGFLAAARKGDFARAADFLETSQKDHAATVLARQLFAVLDSRLPARLNEISDSTNGSLQNPLRPDRDTIAVITSGAGPVEIELTHVDRGGDVPVWLFSRETLEAVPDLYDEASVVSPDAILPQFLVTTRILGVRLYGWLAALVGLPMLYAAITLLARLVRALLRLVVRRPEWREMLTTGLPSVPLKLLALALTIRWALANVGVGLLARHFWSGVATTIAVGAVTWLLVTLTTRAEQTVKRRSPRYAAGGAASLLRLGRRAVDVLIVIAGLLALLGYFGVDATAALAGLGVGGIAVALAAQKTLENVIAGVSLVADQAVRVGDTMKVGDVIGTVESIGLRSTAIRTFDRTVVTIPNGQVAAVTVENLSSRDKFWFHPTIGLVSTTPPAVVTTVVNKIERLLSGDPRVDRESVRVRFLRIGAYSFDIEVFAYIFARDWNPFLEIQEELLIGLLEAVQAAGAELAVPTQSILMSDDRLPEVDGGVGPRRSHVVRRRSTQTT